MFTLSGQFWLQTIQFMLMMHILHIACISDSFPGILMVWMRETQLIVPEQFAALSKPSFLMPCFCKKWSARRGLRS